VIEITARDQPEWEAWLDANHETATEVWLVYWKKASGKQSIKWAEAVEVALKFGWIDGLMRPIDDPRRQRWTPRQPRSRWSKVNRTRAAAHRAARCAAGTRRGGSGQEEREWERAYTVRRRPGPDDLKAAREARPKENQRRVA
jgi:uncharacterized protein YdeI (YjbR/CyaY-like superfamily)